MAFRQAIDMTGMRVGRLLVVRRVENLVARGMAKAAFECVCDCGATIVRSGQALRKNTSSCGCLARDLTSERATTHGHTNTLTYRSWQAMHQRCKSPKCNGFHNYGGRGIRVCERWGVFENFLADMGERPSRNHSIERVDPDGNYEPGNCRWASMREQQNNRRDNVRITLNGETKSMAEWVRATGISRNMLKHRLNNGWSVDDAINEPKRLPGHHRGGELHNSHTILVTIDGETHSVNWWANKLGIKADTAHARVRRGWDPVLALTTPADTRRLRKDLRC